MSARNIRSMATSTSVTRSIAPFLSTLNSLPKCDIITSPARVTASTAVVRSGESGMSLRVDGAACRLRALDHADLHPTPRRALQLHVVHEAADEEDAAAARLQQVLRRQRIRERLRVEARALIPHPD